MPPAYVSEPSAFWDTESSPIFTVPKGEEQFWAKLCL